MKQKWYIDKYIPDVHIWHKIKKLYFRKKTKFQNIQIFELFDCGKSLVINNIPQSSVKDEWIYHECLIHPALILQLLNKKLEILVLGAGEGATLREILKYKNVKKLTAVDIDKEAVEIFKKFFPEMHQGSFNNPKVKLVFDSALNFLKKTIKKYDLIFCDITDVRFDFFRLGSKRKESQLDFYKIIHQKLKKTGIFTMYTCDFSEIDYKDHFHLKKIVKKVFPRVYSFRAYVPFFDDYLGFLIASPNLKFNPHLISEKTLRERMKKQNLDKKLKYFSPEIYKAIFTFPPFLKNLEII